MVSWWTADSNAADVTGTNNGTLLGTATAGAAGMVGGCFTFDGTNGYVQVPDSPLLKPTNLTIEAWVRFTALDSQSIGGSPPGDQYIVFKQNTRAGDFEGYDLSKTRVSGSDVFRFLVTSAAGVSAEIHSSTTVSTGVWYHVVGVRGSNFTQIYVNGALERQTNVAFPQDYGNLPLFLGSSGNATWDHKLRGNLDEVTLFNRALASNEIASLFAAGSAGKCKAVTITSQPQSQSAAIGASATFTVSATGLAPLSYRWTFNGTNISGATTASFTVNNIQVTNGGNYAAVVSNSFGAVTSATAILTVLIPPAITSQPANATNVVGTTANFTVAATGTPSPAYQWRFNGVNLSAATGSSLAVTNVQTSNGGNYTVVASNLVGMVTSSVAVLTIWVPPAISQQPAGQTNVVGTTASFSVAATGTPAPGYQWRFNGAPIAGATGSSLAITNVQTGNGGNYTVVVTNSAGSVTSTVAILTIWVPPAITGQPQNQTNVSGTTANFNVIATGTPTPAYQWLFNSSPIGGATAAGLSLANVQPSNGGNYSVAVSNAAGSVTSSVAVLTIWVPPSISTQPQSQTNVTGTTANFSVTAAGTPAPAFQWQFNGNPIPGATDSSLAVPNVQTNNGGGYTVVITNSAGSITSAVAALTIWVPPSISAHPQSRTNVTGTTASFDVTATGIPAPGFQWRFNDTPLGGATAASLALPNVQPGDGGNYSVVVSNAAGSITSSVALLTIWVPPQISSPPQSRTNVTGTTANFSVTATGSPAPAFQWQFNGAPIAGATDSTLSLPNVQTANGGNFSVVVTNSAGSITSALAVLTVWVSPIIAGQPQSQTNISGTTASFGVAATGTPAPAYQWQFNSSPIAGATDDNLTLFEVQPSNGGNYSVIVSNAAGSITSSVAVLTIWVPPAITFQPVSQTNVSGTTANFSVTATGTPAPAYQWQFNDAVISGATGSNLSLPNVQTNNSGNYAVVVTNSAGVMTSTVATLTIWVAPTISSQPQGQTNVAGNNATFSVAASGIPAPTYQWRFFGSNLSGATGSNLTLTNITPAVGGDYTVIVSNSAGAITSSVAVLGVSVQLVITAQPQSRTNIVGENAAFTIGVTGAPPPALQWQFNGAAIPGATSSNLTIFNVQTNQAGSYTVALTNLAGAATSAVATLTVLIPVQICDINLEDAVRTALGKPEGTLTRVDLARLTSLLVNDAHVASLCGLEWATNMTTFYAGGNLISDVSPLSGLTQLTALFLHRNSITNLAPLAGLTNLTCLELRNNPGITSFEPLGGLSKLSLLSVGGNAISNLTFAAGLGSLSFLGLDHSQISDSTFPPLLPGLTGLDVSYNPLTGPDPILAFGATNLTSLYLSGSPVTNLSFLQSFPALSNLVVYGSTADTPALPPGLSQLRSLNLGGNPGMTTYPNFGALTNLTSLWLYGNELVTASVLSNATSLTMLDLHNNMLSTVDVLAALTQLSHLNLENNQLTNIAGLSGLSSLSSLALGGNLTTNLAPISSLRQLTRLGLANNRTPTLQSLSSLTNLVWLDASLNPITNYNGLSSLTNLVSLSLSANSISNASFLSGLPGLAALDFRDNRLSNLSLLSGLTNLSALWLGGNLITDASVLTSLPLLRTLDLGRNPLSQYGFLSGMTNVSELYLNGVSALDPAAISPLPQLTLLDVSRTRLSNFASLGPLPRLHKLVAAHNNATNLPTLPSLPRLWEVDLRTNLLDITSNSVAMGQIQTLISNKVTVKYIPQNQPPVILAQNYWPIVNTGASLLNFTVDDDVTPLNTLVLAKSSSNPALISSGSMVLGGTNKNRTLTVTPSTTPSNTTIITLTATDDTAQSASVNIQVVAVTPIPVSIPDTNLLGAVCASLLRPIGPLSNVDLLLLTSVRADGSNIVNLTGLEYATNLVYLSLASNLVTSLNPLQGLPNLAFLNLDSNPLTNLAPLGMLPKLAELQLDNNRISNLGFLQGLSNLGNLSLTNNRLTNISVLANLPVLKTVNLFWNVLNTNVGSASMVLISNLVSQGAAVTYLPQIPAPEIDVPAALVFPNPWLIPISALSIAPFSVIQYGNPTGPIVTTVSSSNPILFPAGTVTANRDADGNWRLLVQAPASQGSATLTLTATDELGLVSSINILVTVTNTQNTSGLGVNQPNLAWLSWGDVPWFNETTISHDGFMAAQSGAIVDYRQSLLGTTVSGPGRLSFWWKVSSEPDYDFLEFYLNGALQNRMSGQIDWQQVVCNVPPGTNTLYWRYAKDENTAVGFDAGWVDEVVLTPGVWLEPVGSPANGVAQLLLHGIPGRQYEVQVSSNLVNWTQLILITPNNTSTPVFDSNAKSTRFYRLREISFGTIWFEQPNVNSNAVQLALHSPRNLTLQLQASSDLLTWFVLTNITNTAGTARYTNALTTNNPRRFYRARLIL